MLDFEYKDKYSVDDLRKIVTLLRREGGCPWDREQTHESLKRCMLEEAYEAADAIDEDNREHLREELGDVLLQVMFHADMEDEQGGFDLDDVADTACKKMLNRHPHVFGKEKFNTAGQVADAWDEIKRREKGQSAVADSLKAVAKSLPALWRAEKLQKKAEKSDVRIEIPDYAPAAEDFENAVRDGRSGKKELGDLLFAVVSEARENGIDPEEALGDSCDRFIYRFSQQEREKTGKK